MIEKKTNINYYPGHMAKAKREIRDKMDLVDAVILVLDARIPKSSYVKDVEDFTKNKKKIIVFSKYDLCDKEKTLKWKDYYEKLNYKVILSGKEGNVKGKIISSLNDIMKEENEKRRQKGLLPKKIRLVVVGVSNVGKSSLINKLANKKSLVVGNKPGVTKRITTLKIDDNVELLDTPGVLWPKFENDEIALNLACMSIIKEEVLRLDQVAIHILLKLNKMYPEILFNKFGLKEFSVKNIEESYETISKYKNIPIKNKEVDYDRINLLIINSIKNEEINNITFDEI